MCAQACTRNSHLPGRRPWSLRLFPVLNPVALPFLPSLGLLQSVHFLSSGRILLPRASKPRPPFLGQWGREARVGRSPSHSPCLQFPLCASAGPRPHHCPRACISCRWLAALIRLKLFALFCFQDPLPLPSRRVSCFSPAKATGLPGEPPID